MQGAFGPHLHIPAVQLSALIPPSMHELQSFAGVDATAQALGLRVPTQRERPLPSCSQQPVQVLRSHSQ